MDPSAYPSPSHLLLELHKKMGHHLAITEMPLVSEVATVPAEPVTLVHSDADIPIMVSSAVFVILDSPDHQS